MKKTTIFFSILILIFCFSCVSQEQKEAQDYRNKLQSHVEAVKNIVEDYTDGIEVGKTSDAEAIKIGKELVLELEGEMDEINRIEPFKGDSALKCELVDLSKVIYFALIEMISIGEKYEKKKPLTWSQQQAYSNEVKECRAETDSLLKVHQKRYTDAINEFDAKYINKKRSGESRDDSKSVKEEYVKTNLTGKIFCTSFGMDINCEVKQLSTDMFTLFYFIDNNEFICFFTGQDYDGSYTNTIIKGIYMVQNDKLKLKLYSKELLVTHQLMTGEKIIKEEYSENSNYFEFTIFYCNNIPYFKTQYGNEYLTPDSFTKWESTINFAMENY